MHTDNAPPLSRRLCWTENAVAPNCCGWMPNGRREQNARISSWLNVLMRNIKFLTFNLETVFKIRNFKFMFCYQSSRRRNPRESLPSPSSIRSPLHKPSNKPAEKEMQRQSQIRYSLVPDPVKPKELWSSYLNVIAKICLARRYCTFSLLFFQG